VTEEEGIIGDGRFPWTLYFKELVQAGRATTIIVNDTKKLWVAIERVPQFEAIYDSCTTFPSLEIPVKLKEKVWIREESLKEIVRGRLEGSGPVMEQSIAQDLNLPSSSIHIAMLALEQEGFVFRGKYTPGTEETEWCERRLLARIHRYTLQRLRKEIEAVSPADFMRFLFQWQGLTSDHQSEGPVALENVIGKLEGYEAPAVSWEADLLASRIKNYDHSWLDLCCVSGKVIWGRFGVTENSSRLNAPVKTTPIMLVSRRNAEVWKNYHGKNFNPELSAKASQVFDFLNQRGASFFDDIARSTGMFDSQAEEAIAELVSSGLLTADSFNGLRTLLVPAKYKLSSSSRKPIQFSMEQAGRWSLIKSTNLETSNATTLELIAKVLLKRYGVVFRKLVEQESIAPPWRELVKVYRSMEARGEIRGGRFVDGIWGEHFALPEAVTQLREVRKQELNNTYVSISACDPLNLLGVILPGKKISRYFGNRVLFKDGVAVAALEGGEVTFLQEFENPLRWELQNLLIKRNISPGLRAYLGKILS
jgi:ATP-dependent Lhr-like helicase